MRIMASSKAYLDFILDQLSLLEDISYRQMMGEYIIYYRGRVAGGIYDDRFLIRPTAAASAIMPEAAKDFPYEGGSEMLLVSEVDNREFLRDLFEKMYDELPVPKKKKKKAG
jgi:TfoX/Sxy family transcriptional regulator of competence genes